MTLSMDQIRSNLDLFNGIEPIKAEKTIFSIGGRGHYENPISDVLAFYLDPNEEHSLGSLVLKSLLESAGITGNPTLTRQVYREAATEKRNRLDLVLVGDDWVIAIENKIFHEANNPFEDYKKFISDTYPNKTHHYLLLSPKGDAANNWQSLDYGKFIEKIESHLGEMTTNNPNISLSKWVVFLKDFMMNLSTYVKDASMNDERFNAIHNNIARIYELETVKEEFVAAIESKIELELRKSLPKHTFICSIDMWDDGPAFRFYSSKWHGKTNVTLVTGLKSSSNNELRAYIDKTDQKEPEEHNVLFFNDVTSMEFWPEDNNRWACYKSCDLYGFEDATKKLISLAKHLS